MVGLLPGYRAMRREMISAVVAYVIGSAALAAGSVYLVVRYIWPEDGWLAIPKLVLMLLYSIVWGGLFCAAGVWWLLSTWHLWRGIYRCPYCDRPIKRNRYCVCPRIQELVAQAPPPRKRHSAWRHYRKRIGSVLLVYAALIPVAIGLGLKIHFPLGQSLALTLVFLHVVACFALAFAVELSISLLEIFFGRDKRLRKRWAVFAVVLGVWPVSFLVMISIAMAFRRLFERFL